MHPTVWIRYVRRRLSPGLYKPRGETSRRGPFLKANFQNNSVVSQPGWDGGMAGWHGIEGEKRGSRSSSRLPADGSLERIPVEISMPLVVCCLVVPDLYRFGRSGPRRLARVVYRESQCQRKTRVIRLLEKHLWWGIDDVQVGPPETKIPGRYLNLVLMIPSSQIFRVLL